MYTLYITVYMYSTDDYNLEEYLVTGLWGTLRMPSVQYVENHELQY